MRTVPAEWDAYFPAAILLVDRRALLDRFVASGVIVQARLAVVCADGTPANVVRWLCRGLERGFRAPVGYLHDASTLLYPFALEPLATFVRVLRPGEQIQFRDLGLPPGGLDPQALPFPVRSRRPIREVAAAPPAAIIGYAARELMSMIARDPWLAPLSSKRRSR